MRFLVVHGHTLYGKVTIPLALRLAAEGHEVHFRQHRHGPRRFSPAYVRAHPTSVAIVDRRSLDYVAGTIGYRDDWRAAAGAFRFPLRPRARGYDAVVGTTKELDVLRRLAAVSGVPTFALGYQHMPFVVHVGTPAAGGPPSTPLLEPNAFTDEHRFRETLGGDRLAVCGFTYLDRVHERGLPAGGPRDRALVFHPGGYRDVVTRPGERREASHDKQLAFLERACLPLVEAGLRPAVKVHPLRARFHDVADVEAVLARLAARHGLAADAIDVLGPDEWYWDVAARSAVILNYGSSSLYELWSAGLSQAVVCNFEGTARSARFALFDGVFVETHGDYVDLLRSGRYRGLALEGLAARIFDGYHGLFDGRAVERAVAFLLAGIRGIRPG